MNAIPEKLRYLISGAWNTFFGWASFALTWTVFGPHTSLWLIGPIAHLLATTQAFFVQRHFVFRQTSQSIALQFIKFQMAYLMLLLLGTTAVVALSAQGVHPLVAQVLTMALLAVCGFVLGKSFTFSPDGLSLRIMTARMMAALRIQIVPIGVSLLSLAGVEYCWRAWSYHALAIDRISFDEVVARLQAGQLWLHAHGVIGGLVNPPDFHADLRSAYYSPAQWFTLILDPRQALHASALLFSVLAFWGGYAMARRVLVWRMTGAIALAVVGAASVVILFFTDVAGVFGPALGLWPWLVLALYWPREELVERNSLLWPAMGVAWCLTMWLQFGVGQQLQLALLISLLACWILPLRKSGVSRMQLTSRLAAGLALALVLNGASLYEASNLPWQDTLTKSFSFVALYAGEWHRAWVGQLVNWSSQLVFWLMVTLVVLHVWRVFLRNMTVQSSS